MSAWPRRFLISDALFESHYRPLAVYSPLPFLSVVRGDPLKLLIQFLGDKGIRPFDLFRTFDKDHQHRVSREQFISGLKV